MNWVKANNTDRLKLLSELKDHFIINGDIKSIRITNKTINFINKLSDIENQNTKLLLLEFDANLNWIARLKGRLYV